MVFANELYFSQGQTQIVGSGDSENGGMPELDENKPWWTAHQNDDQILL
jgi:hypothetical protein